MQKEIRLFMLNDIDKKISKYKELSQGNLCKCKEDQLLKIKKDLENNCIENIEGLLDIIKLYQRTLKFVYKQNKLANISLNYNDCDSVCDILNDCQDMINVGLGITDLNYEIKEEQLKYKNLEDKKDKDNNIYYFHINDLNELSDINSLIERIKRESSGF